MSGLRDHVHKLLDQVPEQSLGTAIEAMEIIVRQVAAEDRARLTEAVKVWVEDDDTAALYALNASALARDWDSPEDRINDRTGGLIA